MDQHRRELVTDLMQWRRPLTNIQEELRRIPWDPPDDERVVLDRTAVASAIRRALREEVSVEDLTSWAHALEMRDDVELESSYRSEIRAILFDLSNPDVQGELTPDTLEGLLGRIGLPEVRKDE